MAPLYTVNIQANIEMKEYKHCRHRTGQDTTTGYMFKSHVWCQLPPFTCSKESSPLTFDDEMMASSRETYRQKKDNAVALTVPHFI